MLPRKNVFASDGRGISANNSSGASTSGRGSESDMAKLQIMSHDFGRTSRVNPQPGEQVQNGIASAGIGMRLSQQKSFNLRIDLANIRDPGGTRERNHWRGTLASVLTF